MNKQLLQMEMRTGLVKGSGLLYVVVCFVGEYTNLHKPLCPCRVYGPLEINVLCFCQRPRTGYKRPNRGTLDLR